MRDLFKILEFSLFHNHWSKSVPKFQARSTSTGINVIHEGPAMPSAALVESFAAMLSRHQGAARRSVAVETLSLAHAETVYHSCATVGDISTAIPYTACNTLFKHKQMLLVEYREAGAVEELLRMSCLPCPLYSSQGHNPLPRRITRRRDAHTRLMDRALAHSFSSAAATHWNKLKQLHKFRRRKDAVKYEPPLRMSSMDDVSQQMQLHYSNTRCTELGTRLRFLACRQLELLLRGTGLPAAAVLPFGSTVNGFGVQSSDLDTVLLPGAGAESQTKEEVVAFLRRISNTLRTDSAPGCDEVRPILKARVPIIKYSHLYTGLECDLSMTSGSGVGMSELLHLYSILDQRVVPLVLFVRLWARNNSLTSEHPGHYITNFCLTLLVLYYLIAQRILPPLHLLQQHAHLQQGSKSMSDVDFLRDVQAIASLHQQPQGAAQLSLAQLLHGFFRYYRNFDFRNRGVSIIKGEEVENSCKDAMHIENPLEPLLNVSRVVPGTQRNRFTQAVRRASIIMEHDDGLQAGNSISLWPEQR